MCGWIKTGKGRELLNMKMELSIDDLKKNVEYAISAGIILKIETEKGEAFIVPAEQYEDIVETLEVMSDKELYEGIKRAKEEIKGRDVYDLEKVFQDV
jgi:PHD/YefM family antitoxin component YafN of YafNO toxin-antitoxin module